MISELLALIGMIIVECSRKDELVKIPGVYSCVRELAIKEELLGEDEPLTEDFPVSYVRYTRILKKELPNVEGIPSESYWEGKIEFNNEYQEYCETQRILNPHQNEYWNNCKWEAKELGKICKELRNASMRNPPDTKMAVGAPIRRRIWFKKFKDRGIHGIPPFVPFWRFSSRNCND